MAAIVAEYEPFTGWNLNGSKIIFIPILFVDFVHDVTAETRRQQISLARQLVVPNVFGAQRDINNVVVWRDGIRFPGVMDDGAAIFPVCLENVDKVELSVNVRTIYI
jgi:hypothetical protein